MNYQSEQIDQLATALAAAQAELEPAEKNSSNPHLKSRYADLTSIYTAIRAVLPKHGLSVVQTMMPNSENKAHVRTTLMHISGQWIAGECILPSDKQNGVQGIGSAITYARRYSLSAIVGVVSEEDDDGAGAMPQKGSTTRGQQNRQTSQGSQSNPNAMTEPQRKALMAYLTKRHGNDSKAYCNELSQFFKKTISSSKELTKAEVSSFLNAINSDRAA